MFALCTLRLRNQSVVFLSNASRGRFHTSSLVSGESSTTTAAGVSPRVSQVEGLPVLTIPASNGGSKLFTLTPGTTIGSLASNIANEFSYKNPVVFSLGEKFELSSSSDVKILYKTPFNVSLDGTIFDVKPEVLAASSTQTATLKLAPETLAQFKQLYNSLDPDKQVAAQADEIETQLLALKTELAPMEKIKADLDTVAARRTSSLAWFGIGAMAFQFGVLAQLTWFEYSWDIVEPITYFVTYAAIIGSYSYFVVTRENYEFTGVRFRKWLQYLHKAGPGKGLNINRYNHLKDTIQTLEYKLQTLSKN